MEVIEKSQDKQIRAETIINLEEDENNVSHDDELSSEESIFEETRHLRDRTKLKKSAVLENYVLITEHGEPDSYKEVIVSENSDKWL